MSVTAGEFLPLELVFNPNWWHRGYGICFDQAFYFDRQTRMADDVRMRQVLHQRYARLGLGEAAPQRRAIIGSMHVAGGFVLPALFGAEVVFSDDQPPWVRPRGLSVAEAAALQPPDIYATSPFRELVADMEAMEKENGSVVGDFDTDGVLNTALTLRGQDLHFDLYDDPAMARRLFDVLAETQGAVALAVRQHTGSCAIATNRMITRVDPAIYVHSNCSVQMISPAQYEALLLPVEKRLAQQLAPYGIHHCGDNMHRFAGLYARVPAVFFDVGWGSDVAACRQQLPDAFFSLRLSPVRMLRATPQEVAADTEALLRTAGPLQQAGVCCINMDYGTPDDNIFAVWEVVQRYRGYGA
jgi:Uroporphyrinogen decarboxylase (URO-D)